MPTLPPRADLEQLRRQAKELLRAARSGDASALAQLAEVGREPNLAMAQRCIAREHGFASWPALHLEIARRQVLDRHDAAALTAFLAASPTAATTDLAAWRDHPAGASALGYLAMARYDTTTGKWRNVAGTGAAAQVLLARGAPVDGEEHAPETPLITAASYGDADLAAVLIAAGANVDATAKADSGGVPSGSALLHAAVFGMTDVMDLLVAAGAKVRSFEEAAAAGDLRGWRLADADEQTRIRALVMAADHQRLAVMEQLLAAGIPVDRPDARFHRHALRLAAANGRPASVAFLLAHGADAAGRDARGRTALDLCRLGREHAADREGHDAVEAMLTPADPNGRSGRSS